MAAKEIIWCHHILEDLSFFKNKPTIFYFDSQSAIWLALNQKFHSQTKYVDIKYHMFKEQVKNQVL